MTIWWNNYDRLSFKPLDAFQGNGDIPADGSTAYFYAMAKPSEIMLTGITMTFTADTGQTSYVVDMPGKGRKVVTYTPNPAVFGWNYRNQAAPRTSLRPGIVNYVGDIVLRVPDMTSAAKAGGNVAPASSQLTKARVKGFPNIVAIEHNREAATAFIAGLQNVKAPVVAAAIWYPR